MQAAEGMVSDMSTFSAIFSLIVTVLLIVAMWKLFEKAGHGGWKSLIPIYNVFILCRIVYGAGIKCLLFFVPILNIIVSIMFWFRLAEAYGKGIGFGVGLLFLPNVFTLILAFGDAQYDGPVSDVLF